MTEDLDRWLAEKCMGWIKGRPYARNVAGITAHQDAYFTKEGAFVIYVYQWRPTVPATGQIWLCIERMRERGWQTLYENSILDNLNRVTLYIPAAGILDESWSAKGEAQDPNPALAIGKAIYEALKEEE